MIKKLPKQIINKIAAGEAINHPVNGKSLYNAVIKELVENSIDADASDIIINIQEGGLKKIEILDNGKGIPVEDYPLLCERHATSKISKVDDLQTLSSFGFRGEALASLSHVTEVLKITSKHVGAKMGKSALFKDEKIVKN